MYRPFISYKNLGRSFVRFVTIHACVGQTDGRRYNRRTFSGLRFVGLKQVHIVCAHIRYNDGFFQLTGLWFYSCK